MNRQELSAELMRATELVSRGEVDSGLALMARLEDAVSEPRLQAEVWARYATLFAVLELTEEMQGAVVRALMLDGDNARANYLRGVQLMADQQYDEAIAALHRAASLYPQGDTYHLAEVYGNLGYCHESQGDPDRASMYWEMARELDPDGDEGEAIIPEPTGAGEVVSPPPGCGALERVEAMLKQVGALGAGESLYKERDVGEEEEDDDYWRIDDDGPPRAKRNRPADGEGRARGKSTIRGGKRRPE